MHFILILMRIGSDLDCLVVKVSFSLHTLYQELNQFPCFIDLEELLQTV